MSAGSMRKLLSISVLGVALSAWGSPALAQDQTQSGRSAATQELSVATQLQDRREVAAGTRAYSLGFEDGRFYANGWHITGEMGGIWTPPLKLLDGIWFGVGGQWIGPATKFTSGWGYTRYTLPNTAGLQVSRTDFVPDGPRGVLFGLKVTNPGSATSTTLAVDAHSELMGQYPWGFSVTPNASYNLLDRGRFDGKDLVFTDNGALPGTPVHHYAALVGSALTPTSGVIGQRFWGPQPGHRCTGTEPVPPLPSQCDDGPYGHGTGGELKYSLSLPAGATRTVWFAVAGSDDGLASARQQMARVLAHPQADFAAKTAYRRQLAAQTQLSLPGDPLVQKAVQWGKQNLADLTLSARNLKIRWTNQGKQFPAPLGTVRKATWIGAGYPDYPWMFATDAEYTAFAAVAMGQFGAIEDHLRALRDISDILNHGSGVVVHETVSDGSVYFGHDSKTTNADGTVTNDFNTDETVKFPSAVALVWRWTGDNAFRDQMYDFTIRNLRYVVRHLDVDHDGWPEGSGNVERTGMGAEKLDNAVYLIRGLYDLADMAKSKHDSTTYAWAMSHAANLRKRFDNTWWDQAARQYADSLIDPGNQQTFQQYWIGQVPMEAELTVGKTVIPGVAPYHHGNAALAGRENSCYSGTPPYNRGLFHTGCSGPPSGSGEKVIYGLTTSIQSIGEGNYGRLGAGQQQRYIHALASPMFAEPAMNGTPDEQPGAMPEIFPSPDQGANIDRCWTCRSMFMQAWGNYGTAWAVVHQWLGVSPDLGQQLLRVVPEIPQGQPSVAGRNIRLGSGSVDVSATRSAGAYVTDVTVHGLASTRLLIGYTLPHGTQPVGVTLDGHPVTDYRTSDTNRGTEVVVPTTSGHHVLTVTG